MQVAALIFLDRTWETDQAHINNILSYFVELGSKPNILFFPEGKTISVILFKKHASAIEHFKTDQKQNKNRFTKKNEDNAILPMVTASVDKSFRCRYLLYT